MHYYLVNGTSQLNVINGAHSIKYHLTESHKAKVKVISDPWLNLTTAMATPQDIEDLLIKLRRADVRSQDKLSLILERRERLMHEEILPAMSDGYIVLYDGGFLLDHVFIDDQVVPFETVLRENLEMLQCIGGVAYPAGSIVIQTPEDSLDMIVPFEQRARKLGESMSRFKRLRYTATTEPEDLEMLIHP